MPRKSSVKAAQEALASRAPIGLPDPDASSQEALRLAKEGNLKLCKAVDVLRAALENITLAEYDRVARCPVAASDLRRMAVEGLDAYSRLTGQSWRRHKLQGSYAGDRNLNNVEAYDG